MALIINGETIDDAEIREEAKSLRPRYLAMMDGGDPIALEIQLREWSRENVIERVLMRQEAARRGLDPTDLVTTLTSKISPPKYKEIGDFYKKNKQHFWMPEIVRVSQIIRNVEENGSEEEPLKAIKAAERELLSGAPFAEVADRWSDCVGQGGELGWFPRQQMVQEFDDVVFALEIGRASGIFQTRFGFHIALVTERKPPGIRGLMDVRSDVEEMLRNEKYQRALENFVDALKARASIEG